jgi:hypothetical protein
MSVAPGLDWGKRHVAREVPLDPGYCVCGVALDAPEHIPAPPKVDSAAFMKRRHIKEFIDRHGQWSGEIRTLVDKRGRRVEYTHEGVDSVAEAHLDQEIIDLLWLHADRGTCRGCNAEIFWMKSQTGKAMPYSKAGVVHFVDCPARKQFSKGS